MPPSRYLKLPLSIAAGWDRPPPVGEAFWLIGLSEAFWLIGLFTVSIDAVFCAGRQQSAVAGLVRSPTLLARCCAS